MKQLFTFLIFSFFTGSFLYAQEPTVQDCYGAKTICQESYDEPTPYQYSGQGNYYDEIQTENDDPCVTQENNGVWYSFTAQSSGDLRFTITPHDTLDDYDWIVFDVTNATCTDIATEANPYIISSNTYGGSADDGLPEGWDGLTGANSNISGGNAGTCNGNGPDNGPPFNDDIPVEKGNSYFLYVSNWSGSENGYFIDFSASTAQIYDDAGPWVTGITDAAECEGNELTIRTNENVKCQGVDKTYFSLTKDGSAVDISEAYSDICREGGQQTRSFHITTTNNFQGGDYKLRLVKPLQDVCNNSGDLASFDFSLGPTIQNVTHTNIDCYGDTDGQISIDATTPASSISYSINNGTDFFDNNGSFDNLSAGEYQVAIKDDQNCRVQGDKVTITQPDEVIIDNIDKKNVEGCYGDETGQISISASGGTGSINYSIDGSNFSADGLFQQLAAGEYTPVVKDANDCEKTGQSVQLTQPDSITFSYDSQDVTGCDGEANGSISVTSQGGTGEHIYTLNGSQSQSQGTFNGLDQGNYAITISDVNNCTAGFEVYIDADYLDCLEIPTVFTPNGDGVNDQWQMLYIHLYPDSKVYIFDRWGKLLTTYNPSQQDWNGICQQKKLPVDTYFYKLELDKKKLTINGTITIIY